MMNGPSARSFWRTVLTFSVAGPPIGALVLLAPVTFQAIAAGQFQSAALVPLAALFYGYVFGLLPAGITGILSSAISPFIQPLWAWALVAGAVGWLVSALVMGLAGLLSDDLSTQILNGYVGAIAAVVCALLVRKHRPIRSGPVQTAKA